MIKTILELDQNIFLMLNGLHFEWLDPIMLALSYNKWMMAVLILSCLTYMFYVFRKKAGWLFLTLLIVFGLSDSISTRVFKHKTKRLRPCHQQELKQKVYLAGQRCWGGKYGFVSSHASNSFAIATFFWLLFIRRRKFFSILFLYAGFVSYSRVYLARHFPLDIICGGFLGFLIAFIAYKLLKKFKETLILHPSQK